MPLITLTDNIQGQGEFKPTTVVYVPVRKYPGFKRADFKNWSFSNDNTTQFVNLRRQTGEDWMVEVYNLDQIPYFYRPEDTWGW